jgi:hypothetical protein
MNLTLESFAGESLGYFVVWKGNVFAKSSENDLIFKLNGCCHLKLVLALWLTCIYMVWIPTWSEALALQAVPFPQRVNHTAPKRS